MHNSFLLYKYHNSFLLYKYIFFIIFPTGPPFSHHLAAKKHAVETDIATCLFIDTHALGGFVGPRSIFGKCLATFIFRIRSDIA
ncbi:hypothetical protein ACJX0J_006910, partial [Zea mays]